MSVAAVVTLICLLQLSSAAGGSQGHSNRRVSGKYGKTSTSRKTQPGQIVQASQSSVPTRVALFNGSWGVEAVAKLSAARSSTVKLWNSYMRAHNGVNPTLTDVEGLWGNYKPFISCPPGMALQRVGDGGDGGKLICGISTLKAPCLIYSLGSNGQYDFELSVLNSTGCEVHTFDCTYNGSSQLPGRHFYHKICMGTDQIVNGSIYLAWGSVLQNLGHKHVDLLKVDIEGFEVDFLGDWSDDVADYPSQLTIELHYRHRFEKPKRVYTLGEMALFVNHLYNIGYAMYSMEVNPDCKKCSEFSFVRVEGPARRSAAIAKKARQHLLRN